MMSNPVQANAVVISSIRCVNNNDTANVLSAIPSNLSNNITLEKESKKFGGSKSLGNNNNGKALSTDNGGGDWGSSSGASLGGLNPTIMAKYGRRQPKHGADN